MESFLLALHCLQGYPTIYFVVKVIFQGARGDCVLAKVQGKYGLDDVDTSRSPTLLSRFGASSTSLPKATTPRSLPLSRQDADARLCVPRRRCHT